jgi:hypothetical protein
MNAPKLPSRTEPWDEDPAIDLAKASSALKHDEAISPSFKADADARRASTAAARARFAERSDAR